MAVAAIEIAAAVRELRISGTTPFASRTTRLSRVPTAASPVGERLILSPNGQPYGRAPVLARA